MRCEPNISLQEKGKWKYENGQILPIGDYKLNSKVEVKKYWFHIRCRKIYTV